MLLRGSKLGDPPSVLPVSRDSAARAIGLAPWLSGLLVAAVVELSTDTPELGPFYGVWPASQRTSAFCAAALVVLAIAALPRTLARSWPPWCVAAMRLIPPAAAIAAFSWTAPMIWLSAGERWDLFVGVTLTSFALLALGSLRRAVPAAYVAALALFTGLVLRTVHFRRFGPHVGADMIPLVTSAVDRLLAGQSPYSWHHVPHPLPLTYYPLTVLAYVPARLLSVDLRWTNVAAHLGVLAAMRWAAGVRLRTPDSASDRQKSEPATIAWSAVFLLPSSIYFDRITTAPIAWAMLAWLLVLIARASRHAWLLLALSAATTPLAALFVPFAALAACRARGARRAAVELLAAGALAALLLLPWYVWAPADFVEGTVLWFNDLDRYPRQVWNNDRAWERYVGFGGLFWDAGRERWLKPLQGALVLLAAALYARRSVPVTSAPAYAAFAFASFMAFNPVHWPYFYQPVIVLLLIAASLRQASQ